jgi:hypothetical protein
MINVYKLLDRKNKAKIIKYKVVPLTRRGVGI